MRPLAFSLLSERVVQSAHGFIGATLGHFSVLYLELADCRTSYFSGKVMILLQWKLSAAITVLGRERANYFQSAKCKHCIKQKVFFIVGEIRLRNFILVLQGKWFFCGWYWRSGYTVSVSSSIWGSVDHDVKIPVWFCNFIFYIAMC